MKQTLSILIFAITLNCSSQNLFIFSKTNGFRHPSIDSGKEAFKKIAEQSEIDVTFSEDSLTLNSKTLKKIDILLFLNTTGDILSAKEQKAVEDFIRNGGRFLGIHAASDTEYDWKWYGGLVGRYFNGHPKFKKLH